MKISCGGLILLLSCMSANADECSGQVDGYLKGLKTGATLAAVDKKARDAAIDQVAYIATIRAVKSDCEVRALIPQLSKSDQALKNTYK